MKTINNAQILQKSIDIKLRRILQNDIKLFRTAQQRTTANNQGAKKAA